MEQNFMRTRPVGKLLASMAMPMVISMLVNSLYNIVDSYFVAKISEEAMTALSLVYPVQNFINAAAIGFGVGMNAVIAYFLGAGDRDKAGVAATHGMAYSVLHGVLLMIGSIVIMPSFLRAFTSDPAVADLGVRYSNVAFSFSVIIMLGLSFEKIFQSVGQMKVTMAALMSGCVANIVLDPLLIFGIGPFPEMGIEGAALATGIGQVLTLVIYLVVYFARPLPVRICRCYSKADRRIDARLYAVGIPAILNLALPSILISALNSILAAFSQSYVVVLGVYYKLQTFLYLPANGIVQGMRPLLGFNFGAGEMKRVRSIYNLTLVSNCLIMALGTVLCLVIPGQLIGLFTDNAQTIAFGETALRVISAGFIVSSVSVTSSGALEGLGKGGRSLVISLCRYILIILPAAFLLSRVFGAAGVWHAFWVAELLTAVVAVFVYRSALKIRPHDNT